MYSNGSFAQFQQNIKVSKGEDLGKAVKENCFRFASFTKGEIFYKYGKSGESQLNYNILSEEMLFIEPHGDTLIVSNPTDISYLKIGETLFYYDNGYKEIIADYTITKLAIHQIAAIEFVKLGSMGENNTTSAITNVDHLNTPSYYYDLALNQDAYIRKKTFYYFTDSKNHFLKATKSSIFKIFSSKKEKIELYLKENDINFNKESDLVKLLEFCTNKNG